MSNWPSIPSSGRGNSEQGDCWENPNPQQLFNALKRKNKLEELVPKDQVLKMYVFTMIWE